MNADTDDMDILTFFRRFPDDDAAEAWFVSRRWPDGIVCPLCQSMNIQTDAKHPEMPYRCRECRHYFSVKTGSIMHSSKLGYQQWALALYLLTTSKKGISSADLGRKLGISRKAAWHLSHRIRDTFADDVLQLSGTVETDETGIGGHDRWRHLDKKRGRNSQLPVLGVKERETGRVQSAVAPGQDTRSVQGWLHKNVAPDATLYTDQASVYIGANVKEHDTVNHRKKEYVRGDVHTNGIESYWALLKRGYKGTHHFWSDKHMHRYLREFDGRFNSRTEGTAKRIEDLADNMEGKRLPYRTLTGSGEER